MNSDAALSAGPDSALEAAFQAFIDEAKKDGLTDKEANGVQAAISAHANYLPVGEYENTLNWLRDRAEGRENAFSRTAVAIETLVARLKRAQNAAAQWMLSSGAAGERAEAAEDKEGEANSLLETLYDMSNTYWKDDWPDPALRQDVKRWLNTPGTGAGTALSAVAESDQREREQ